MSTSTASAAGRKAERGSWLIVALGRPSARGERHKRTRLGARVVGARPDDLAVAALLEHVRRPAGRAADDEERREHGRWYPERVIGHRAVPVEVRKQALGIPEHRLEALGNGEQPLLAGRRGEAARDFLDHVVAWIGDGIDRMSEADDDFLGREAPAYVRLGLVRRRVAALYGVGDLVGAAVLRSPQRADR